MSDLLFLKLGGSLVTDKTRPQALRADVLARLAREIAAARDADRDLRLLLGHGSGSFGHVTAKRYGTRAGVRTPEEWRGFAETGKVAAELSRWVVEALWEAGVPALRVQPSASAVCRDGELLSLADRPIVEAIEHGLLPVVHGDIAFDEARGGTIISTEEIFAYLAARLRPARIILAGEVDGVLTADPASGIQGEVIPLITPANLGEVEEALGGSRGVDVTGGMVAKVREMLALAQHVESLREIHIISGLRAGLVRDALLRNDIPEGTRVGRQSKTGNAPTETRAFVN
jgi:isopentenyl phosphate kinase